jgi:hypothetical protein
MATPLGGFGVKVNGHGLASVMPPVQVFLFIQVIVRGYEVNIQF